MSGWQTDERQRWRCLAGATACAASLDAHDDEDNPDLLAGFLAHWRRPGKAGTRQELATARYRIAEREAGHAPGCPAANVEERVSTTRTLTCAACGDVLLEETIAGA